MALVGPRERQRVPALHGIDDMRLRSACSSDKDDETMDPRFERVGIT